MPDHPKPRSVLERENKDLLEKWQASDDLRAELEAGERKLRMEADSRAEGYRIERDRLAAKADLLAGINEDQAKTIRFYMEATARES